MNEIPLKHCSRDNQCVHHLGCWQPATTEYFYPSKTLKDGLDNRCIECRKYGSAIRSISYSEWIIQKEKRLALLSKGLKQCSNGEYCSNPRGSILPATPEYFNRCRKTGDGLVARCKFCTSLESAKYHQENKETRKNNGILWREKNHEYAKELSNKWYKDNRPRAIATVQRRQARKRELPADLSNTEWEQALNYFNGCCAVCGRPPGLWHILAADHWIPLNSPICPGTVVTNIVPLCHGLGGCNNSKGAKDPIDWLIEQFGKRRTKKILARIEAYFEWVQTQS